MKGLAVALVFSIAFNGYDEIWRDCIVSQGEYCKRMGYTYHVVGAGVETPLNMESAWLKVPLIMAAMDSGHEWVAFLDSDVEATERAPRVEVVHSQGKDVYLADGFSSRPNSGVILARSTETSRRFFQDVLEAAGKPLRPEHVVGWGENGEIISVSSTYSGYQKIDRRWNNNSSASLDDFMRHYSAGPLRKQYKFTEGGRSRLNSLKSMKALDTMPGTPVFYDNVKNLLLASAPKDAFRCDRVSEDIDRIIAATTAA